MKEQQIKINAARLDAAGEQFYATLKTTPLYDNTDIDLALVVAFTDFMAIAFSQNHAAIALMAGTLSAINEKIETDTANAEIIDAGATLQ